MSESNALAGLSELRKVFHYPPFLKKEGDSTIVSRQFVTVIVYGKITKEEARRCDIEWPRSVTIENGVTTNMLGTIGEIGKWLNETDFSGLDS